MAADQTEPPNGGDILTIAGLSKQFGGVQALDDVSFEVQACAIHALIGENGAGKSTLIKILAGNLLSDRGTITFRGREFAPRGAAEARSNGVSVIHQELTVIPHLSVAENIFLGALPTTRCGFVNRRALMDGARALIERIGLDIDPAMRAGDLAIGLQQMVEIAKSLAARADLLIMDEPTSSLSLRELARLWEVVRELRASGKTIIFVSHRLDEIFAMADRITVLRDGRHVRTCKASDIDSDQLVATMVGHELSYAKKSRSHTPGEDFLVVRGLNRRNRFTDIDFTVRAGEIVGFAGLVGAGRTEVARSIFGADRADSGTVKIGGQKLRLGDPRRAIAAGVGFVPENRKEQALFLQMSVLENVALPDAGMSRFGILDRKAETSRASEAVQRLRVVAASVHDDIAKLSGGNQQKVVLARWLALRPRMLIVDEPTRGIDVGAKAEIHELLRDFARQGIAVVMVSSELPEVLALSDRVLVMRGGRIVADLPAEEATEEVVAGFAIGVTGAGYHDAI